MYVAVDRCHSHLNSCIKTFDRSHSLHKDAPSDVHYKKKIKSIGIRFGVRGGHAIYPPRPFHLPGYFAFKHKLQYIFHIMCWSSVLLKPQPLLHIQGHAFKQPCRTIFIKLQYLWADSLSRRKYGPMMSLTVWNLRSWIAWGLFHVQVWPIWALSTPSLLGNASYDHITSWKETHSQHVAVATIRKQKCVPRVSGMDAADHHELLGGPLAGIVSNIVWYRLSFSTVLIPHLQWLALVQSFRNTHL
jgi:hypothetical protein